jgi:nucleotide-binding universal stress UspA family protein
MILLSYDGSADAQAAIDDIAQLMPGAEATVLTVWEPFMLTLARNGAIGLGGGYGDVEAIDEASQAAALSTAQEGVERATAAGLSATPRSACTQDGIANTILGAATEIDADVIALGTRGLSGVKSLLLGSVSHAVVHHADRAVLVVPDPAVAARRHESLAHVATLA